MQYCSECNAIEQGTIELIEGDETIEVCSVCQTTDDSMQNFDEDAGKDR